MALTALAPICSVRLPNWQICTRPPEHDGDHRHDSVYGEGRASHFTYWQREQIRTDLPMPRARYDRFQAFLLASAAPLPLPLSTAHLHLHYSGRGQTHWRVALRPSTICKVPGRCVRAAVFELVTAAK